METEISKTTDTTWEPMPSRIWAFLSVVTAFTFFYGLTLPFLGPDEARYAQVGREMLYRHDWVTPTLGGVPWFEKPALLYWLEICSYKLFGVSEFGARFGPALFGLGTVASLWTLGRFVSRTLLANSGVMSAEFPKWLALIAATTLGITVFSRGASFDIIITFPITAALVSFFIFDRKQTERSGKSLLPLTFFYLFIGIALLAKGLIGIVFPLSIVGFYYILSWRIPTSKFLGSLVWGTLLAVAVALIWYWPVYARNGYEFIEEFFIEHHFQRFTSNKYQHPQPFFFFLWVLPLMTLPWLPFFFGGIWKLVRQILKGSGSVTGKANLPIAASFSDNANVFTSLSRLAVAWIAVPLLFFSFSGSKLPGYILPAVPGAIVLTATYLFALVEKSKKWRYAAISMATLMLVLTVLLLTFVVPRFAESDSVRSLISAANDGGHLADRVISLHTISYNAEFYAAGRLLRDETGKQRRMSGVGEVVAEIQAKHDSSVLVLVPLEYVSQLTASTAINTTIIKDNGELAIAAVSLK